MKINDRIYGEFEITEPVLIELINSKAIQRLKDISQQGVPLKYNHQVHFSRYDHSIGVMLLLKKLGASLQEQIAGLLHDVSHPTFSHLIDWIDGDPKVQNHQDSQFVSILNSSDIPQILERNGFNKNDFYNLEKYSLLERPSPDLCADRVDYTLRDLVAHGAKTISDELLSHLTVFNSSIVFDSLPSAHTFAEEYLALQFHNWGDDRNNAMFHVFSIVLKTALEEGILERKDFLLNEEYIINKLEKSTNNIILNNLKLLKEGFFVDYSQNNFQIKCKFRYVDPSFVNGTFCKKLSDELPSYKYRLDLHRENFEKPKFVEVRSR